MTEARSTGLADIIRYESAIWAVADLSITASVKQSDSSAYMMPFFALTMLEGRMRNAVKKWRTFFRSIKYMRLVSVALMFVVVLCRTANGAVEDTIAQMKKVHRTSIEFPRSMTMRKFVDYCQAWADEEKLDSVKFALQYRKTDKGEPLPISVRTLQFKNISMFDLVENVCKGCYHMVSYKSGRVVLAPNLPEFMEYIEWTNIEGKKISAKWVGFTPSGSPLLLMRNTGKFLVLSPKKLTAKYRNYVNNPEARRYKLVYKKVGDTWMSPLEILVKEMEDTRRAHIKRADSMLRDRSLPRGSRYKVIFPYEDGSLCRVARLNNSGGVYDYDGEWFWQPVLTRATAADGDCFTSNVPMYWLGTYSYKNQNGDTRTVNVYRGCEYAQAITILRYRQGWYEDWEEEFDQFKPSSQQAPRPSDKISLCGTGSGFFVTSDGYFVTNYHVVKGAIRIAINTVQGRREAKLIQFDENVDLALVKVSGTYDYVEMSPSPHERLGKGVFTLGFPQPDLQGITPKVTRGIVSGDEGFRGDIKCYQIDASIQPGNSGGAVADENGYLVGVVVAFLARGNTAASPQNVNYAIKKSYLDAFLKSAPDCASKLRIPRAEVSRKFEDAVEVVRKASGIVESYE